MPFGGLFGEAAGKQGGGTATQESPFKGGGLQQALANQDKGNPKSAPVNWNPSGYWPDPMQGPGFRKDFQPHKFIGALVNSKEGQEYGDVEGTAEAIGVQGAREGEQAATEESTQEAASQGLGRGFAAQQKTNIHQEANARVSEQMLGAHLEGQSRRWQQAALIANSLLEANKARFTRYLNKQAADSAESSALIGALGTIGGGIIGGVLGGPIGAGIGAAIGGGAGNAAGGGGGGGGGDDSVGYGGQGMS